MIGVDPAYEAKRRELAALDAKLEERRVNQLVRAARDYRAFCEYVIEDERSGQGIILEPIHLAWIEHIQTCWERGLHAAIAAPFGSGKTSIVGALPLFCLGVNPGLRTRVVTGSDTETMKRVALLRRYIESSTKLRDVFPHLRPSSTQEWTKHALYVERQTFARDPSIEARTIMQADVGARCDFIFFDDCNDPRNTLNHPRLRRVVWDNFLDANMSRLDGPAARACLICTRWHAMDVLGNILCDEAMRTQWGVLIQRVSEDFTYIEQETFYGGQATADSEKEALIRLYRNGVLN